MLTTLATLAVAVVVPAAASANSPPHASVYCATGDSGITVNRAGDVARFSRLTAMRGMNCPSARYVLNKWLRRAFRRSYSRRLPRTFWDGYVTWYCGKLTRLRWQCDEYDSNTRFRFSAAVIN